MSYIKKWRVEYGENNPFFIEDVISDELSYDVAKSVLSRAVSQGELKRYSQGIYYFPRYTFLGESIPSYFDILDKKYLSNQGHAIGYISGNTLLNQVSLSTQVPNVVEITTNMEKTRKRKIKLRNNEAILRKPNIEVTDENVRYLQFLDICKYASLNMLSRGKDKVLDYYDKYQLEFSKLNEYIPYYSSNVLKKMRGSGIYDDIASRQRYF